MYNIFFRLHGYAKEKASFARRSRKLFKCNAVKGLNFMMKVLGFAGKEKPFQNGRVVFQKEVVSHEGSKAQSFTKEDQNF
jgi:hypothetical protein